MSRSKTNEDLTRSALKNALVPIARAMMNAGVTGAEMQSALAQAFVTASLEVAKLKNGKVNQSRVAIMTGYSRTEIRKVLSGIRSFVDGAKPFGAKRILDGWSRDPEFSTRTGLRKPLALHGKYGSFHSLAKKYSGDIPPKAALDELIRTGLVQFRKNHIVAADKKSSDQSRQAKKVDELCRRLGDILSDDDVHRASPGLSTTDTLEFEFGLESALSIADDRARQSGRAFMNGVSASLKTIALPVSANERRAKHRLKVVLTITRRTENE